MAELGRLQPPADLKPHVTRFIGLANQVINLLNPVIVTAKNDDSGTYPKRSCSTFHTAAVGGCCGRLRGGDDRSARVRHGVNRTKPVRIPRTIPLRVAKTVGLLAVVAAAISAPAAASTRSCGTVTAKGQAVSVSIGRGRVSCAQARGVAKSYISGRGTLHGPSNGPRADMYVTIPGGWRCSVIEQGGAGCTSGGSNYLTARNLVEWTYVP